MNSKYNSFTKSVGPVAAQLLMTLYEKNRPVFHLREAQEILGETHSASQILNRLVERGIVTRLKPGTFRLIPFELGFEQVYLGNPLVVARELATKSVQTSKNSAMPDYYVSHGSAFELHQMQTQPQFVTYVTSSRMIRTKIILGTEFRFVKCKSKDLFGLTEFWVEKNEKIYVSNLERTLLDGLKQPSYCGGFTEVAKGFSIKKDVVQVQKLIDYAIKLNVGAVTRRLGFLMEIYNIGTNSDHEILKKQITSTYQLLDPDIPPDGHFYSKWRVRLNVTQEELLALRRT